MRKEYDSTEEAAFHADTETEFTVVYCKCGYTAASSFYKALMGGYWKCPECNTGYSIMLIMNQRQLVRTEEQDMKYLYDGDSSMRKHKRIAKYYEFTGYNTQDETENALRLQKEIGIKAFIHEITEDIKLWAKATDAKPEKNLTQEL
ncbi:MAG: hypothetical protein KGJ90_02505 [Patescibacteria group bacterium]|nr:hypothetical protein [Patescibacteria group bacterium]